MATQVFSKLIDDRDGSDADETVTFGLDGKLFEVDLSEANARELRELLTPWSKIARRLPSGAVPKSVKRATVEPAKVSPTAIREWAKSQGKVIGTHGRISAELAREYEAAHA
jgi:hypothetical protein